MPKRKHLDLVEGTTIRTAADSSAATRMNTSTTTTDNPNKNDEQAASLLAVQTAKADLASLSRVYHRLAQVDSVATLTTVLDKLLPRLLKRIGDNHKQQQLQQQPSQPQELASLLQQIHTKLVEILSHTMKRVREDAKCKLPCRSILELFVARGDAKNDEDDSTDAVTEGLGPLPSSNLRQCDALTINLALPFLAIGIPRLTAATDELEQVLPLLLVLTAATRPGQLQSASHAQQHYQMAHLLLKAVELLVMETKQQPATTTTTKKSHAPDNKETGSRTNPLEVARHLCQSSEPIAAAAFDLFLDVLLYQPVSAHSNIPPAGLSQAGKDRLLLPQSSSQPRAAADLNASRSQRVRLKHAVLELVAPHRRWALFCASSSKTAKINIQLAAANRARTVALLVAATGDAASEVSDRAGAYLKQYLENRNSHTTAPAAGANQRMSRSSSSSEMDNDNNTTAVGDPLQLAVELLILCVGETHADSILAQQQQQQQQSNNSSTITTATTTPAVVERLTGRVDYAVAAADGGALQQQKILSTKRRPVTEAQHGSSMISFVSSRILNEYPNLLLLENTKKGPGLQVLGTLAVEIAARSLSAASSGLSTQQAKPYIGAAELLSALAIRLSVFYDSSNHFLEEEVEDKSTKACVTLMARCLSTVCGVLSSVASAPVHVAGGGRSSGNVHHDGSIAVRDACYGVIATLSRSQFAVLPSGALFARGDVVADRSSSSRRPVSIETATLLFGCAANEEERLRPRAVAALDALLAAYCRAYTTNTSSSLSTKTTTADNEGSNGEGGSTEELEAVVEGETAESSNPWLSIDSKSSAPTTTGSATTGNGNGAMTVDQSSLARSLLPLIWSAAQSYQPKASRVAASRWASDLLKDLQLANACHILCFLAGDSDVTAASIAREGLGLPSHFTNDDNFLATQSADYASAKLPEFSDFAEVLFSEAKASTGSSRLHRYWDFSLRGKAATLHFGLYCLLNDLYGGEDRAVLLYLKGVTETLRVFIEDASAHTGDNIGGTAQGRASIDLLDECSACLLTTLSASQFARSHLTRSETDSPSFQFTDIEFLALKANSSRSRRYLAGACGKLLEDTSLWSGSEKETVVNFDDWVTRSQLASTLSSCSENLNMLSNNDSSGLGRLHGSAFLGAHVVRAFRLRAANTQKTEEGSFEGTLWTKVSQVLDALGKGCLHDEEILGNACADSLSIAFSYDETDAPVLDGHLFESAFSVLTNLTNGLSKFGHSDTVNPTRAAKLAHASGRCLAATTTGSGIAISDANGTKSNLGLARLACVDALFECLGSMAYRKDEEISIVVGEALASYADAYSPENAVWSYPDSREWPSDFEQSYANQLPPHEHVLFVLLRKFFTATSPHKRTACAPALLAIAARGANRVNAGESSANRSIVQTLNAHLRDLQSAFISLLSYQKSSQFSRESCCLGLASCRGLVKRGQDTDDASQTSDELNHRLLRAFGQTTNFGGSALMETQAQAAARRESEARENNGGASTDTAVPESEVGGASGIGEAALGAYREMASASVSLGRHDILYALLLLSVSHSFWSTTEARHRYSALALLGESSFVGDKTSSSEFRNALRPHLGKLLPRILRACYDPNKQTREQMSALWNGLTGGGAEGRSAITQHLLPTIDTLIEDATSKFWRARVGACGALGQIIVGREWSDLGGGGPVLSDDDMFVVANTCAGIRLLRIWKVAMRALDDVRGAVRESGESLARAARGLTIRLCDPSMDQKSNGEKRGREEMAKHERDATAAAATSLRWLIRHGLNQSCDEATGVCLSTLVEVVSLVSPKILEPSLPDLIRSLLMAMSGLEPAALNYLQLRTSDQEGLERIRLQLAQSGPLAAAVTKCLELLPFVALETQQRVAPELDSALRQSAGFATRAATADAVSTLCSTCPNVFRFSGSSSSNPSVRLLRAFYFASERERGAGAKDKMIHALGNLAALCPPSSVRSLALRACERYRSSTGNNYDPASRRAAAAALRTIAVRASSHFGDGGKSDIWCKRVLPCAYLGCKDSDAKISALMKEVWDEGGSAANLADASPSMNSFGSRLEEKLLPALVNECVSALQDVSWSRRVAGSTALVDLCDLGMLSPVARSTGKSSAKTDTEMQRARCRAESSNIALQECLLLATKPRLWTGKADVLNAVVKLASTWVAASASQDIDEQILFGWSDSERSCPWRPLTISPGEFHEDLFAGDRFFLAGEELEVEGNGGTLLPEMDIDENEEGKIEFDDMDDNGNVATEDDEPTDIDSVGVGERSYSVPTFTGLSRFLCRQAMLSSNKDSQLLSDDLLPYRAAAFRCFRDLLNSLPTECTKQRIEIFEAVSPSLMQMFGRERSEMDIDKRPKPVLVAAAIDCMRACLWDGIGASDSKVNNADPKELISILKEAGGKMQPAWTVREAAALCCAQLALKSHDECIRQHAAVSLLVETAKFALTDRKFWRVRVAGLKILESLTTRVGTSANASSDRQLFLEALLPQKEVIVKLLRSSLSDSESKVTSLSSSIIASMSFWP